MSEEVAAAPTVEVVVIHIKDEIEEELTKELLASVEGVPTLMTLVRLAMELIEAKPIKGEAQRDTVIRAVKQCVQHLEVFDEATKANYTTILDTDVVKDSIDLAVDASKGKLSVNKVAKVAQSCISACLAKICSKEQK